MHNKYSDTSINTYRKCGVLSVKSCYMILGNCSLVSNAEGEGRETSDIECNKRDTYRQLSRHGEQHTGCQIQYVESSFHSKLDFKFIKWTITLLSTLDCNRNDSVCMLECRLCASRKGWMGKGGWGHPQGHKHIGVSGLGDSLLNRFWKSYSLVESSIFIHQYRCTTSVFQQKLSVYQSSLVIVDGLNTLHDLPLLSGCRDTVSVSDCFKALQIILYQPGFHIAHNQWSMSLILHLYFPFQPASWQIGTTKLVMNTVRSIDACFHLKVI